MLPPFAGFKSEYWDGTAVWTPRPKTYNAVLDLARVDPDQLARESAGAREQGVGVREFRETDWDDLTLLMAAAFHRMLPFCTLPPSERVQAAADCLGHTRRGGDGGWLPDASVVATDADSWPLGAMLLTRWVPESADERGDDDDHAASSGHITWVFVRPVDCGRGAGTLMLHAAAQRLRLRQRGFARLYTSFLAGNESSMLWHGRNGFRLLPYRGSLRRRGRSAEAKT